MPRTDPATEGAAVGSIVGFLVVGILVVGIFVGLGDGSGVGESVGVIDGATVGEGVLGIAVVGVALGRVLGENEGASVYSLQAVTLASMAFTFNTSEVGGFELMTTATISNSNPVSIVPVSEQVSQIPSFCASSTTGALLYNSHSMVYISVPFTGSSRR